MAALSAQRLIETGSDLASARAPDGSLDTLIGLIVTRVRMAIEGESGPARAALEARLAGPAGTARSRLAELFGLSAGALDLLDLAAALAADPGLADAYAEAQGAPHRVCPTEALARRLFDNATDPHRDEPLWRAGMPLAVWGLLLPIARTAGEP